MRIVGTRLRLCVAAWLVVQSAALFAVVPRDCCAAHGKAADADAHRCEEHAVAAHCPMRATDGTTCPMHRDVRSERSSERCAMRGACDGPIGGLLALLPGYGVMPADPTIAPDLRIVAAIAVPPQSPIASFTPPNAPPPRL